MIVRRWSWVVILAVMALTACATPAPAPVLSRIPASLYLRSEQACFVDVGFHFGSGFSWHYTQGRIVIEDADNKVVGVYFGGRFGDALSQAVVSCLLAVPAAETPWPTRPDARLRLVNYARAVLWPCLRSHGFEPGPQPAIESFAADDGAAAIDPFARPSAANFSIDALLQLAAECPAQPAYLPS